MTDTTLTIPTGIPIVLRPADWRDVVTALDYVPATVDSPGLDALMLSLADKGLLGRRQNAA